MEAGRADFLLQPSWVRAPATGALHLQLLQLLQQR